AKANSAIRIPGWRPDRITTQSNTCRGGENAGQDWGQLKEHKFRKRDPRGPSRGCPCDYEGSDDYDRQDNRDYLQNPADDFENLPNRAKETLSAGIGVIDRVVCAVRVQV